jgi:hypothetical protein
MTQKCIKCGITKELTEFHVNRDATLGVHSGCKTCKSVYRRNKYALNPEKELVKNREWVLNNPEKAKEFQRDHKRKLRKNKNSNDKLKKINKKWRDSHTGEILARNAEYKAAKIKATPKWLTKEHRKEIIEYYNLAKDLAWLSEEPLHVDHIVPLRGENVCGLHVPWNLQILPESINCSKKNFMSSSSREIFHGLIQHQNKSPNRL